MSEPRFGTPEWCADTEVDEPRRKSATTYLYHEAGFRVLVEVLADNTDAEWERLTLRCVEVVRTSELFQAPAVGDVWDVTRTKGPGSAYAGWHLEGYEPGVAGKTPQKTF